MHAPLKSKSPRGKSRKEEQHVGQPPQQENPLRYGRAQAREAPNLTPVSEPLTHAGMGICLGICLGICKMRRLDQGQGLSRDPSLRIAEEPMDSLSVKMPRPLTNFRTLRLPQGPWVATRTLDEDFWDAL